MKNLALLTVLVVLGLALSSGCASMQTWSVYERSVENQMIVIQEKIGYGLKTGALTPDQSQTYLATLKDIQTDYAGLRDKSVSREERNSLQGRVDALEEVINRALPRTKKYGKPTDSFWERAGSWVEWLFLSEKIEEPTSGTRIIRLQRRIDDERSSGRLSLVEASGYQARLDSVRSSYLRMTEGGRALTYEERAVISRLIDSLETDLNHLPQL
jgi:hypothetical protein